MEDRSGLSRVGIAATRERSPTAVSVRPGPPYSRCTRRRPAFEADLIAGGIDEQAREEARRSGRATATSAVAEQAGWRPAWPAVAEQAGQSARAQADHLADAARTGPLGRPRRISARRSGKARVGGEPHQRWC